MLNSSRSSEILKSYGGKQFRLAPNVKGISLHFQSLAACGA